MAKSALPPSQTTAIAALIASEPSRQRGDLPDRSSRVEFTRPALYNSDVDHGSPRAGAEKAKEAQRFLKTREGAAANGEPVMPRAERVHYEEAAADPRQHYDATGARVSPSTIAARRT